MKLYVRRTLNECRMRLFCFSVGEREVEGNKILKLPIKL
jgi:hypothetical protein